MATPIKKIIESKKVKVTKARAKRKPQVEHKIGRPTKYTPELDAKICGLLATGISMRTVSKDPKLPAIATMFRWMSDVPDFREHYEKAKMEAADAMAEDILDIADNGDNDWMIRHGKDGQEAWQLNGEHVQRSRLRIDTRKWLMAKMKPKKYIDRANIDHTTDGDKMPAPVVYMPADMSEDTVMEQVKQNSQNN